MNAIFKGLAIAALLVTVLGAGVVLYGLQTMTPQVEMAVSAVTPASDAQDVFDDALRRIENRTFTGRVIADASGLSAQDASFVTYTVRLNNRGFFPAEWITLTVAPVEGDVLQLPDESAHVLTAGSRGDLSATILRASDAGDTARELELVCYVLGRRIEFTAQAQ